VNINSKWFIYVRKYFSFQAGVAYSDRNRDSYFLKYISLKFLYIRF